MYYLFKIKCETCKKFYQKLISDTDKKSALLEVANLKTLNCPECKTKSPYSLSLIATKPQFQKNKILLMPY